MTEFQERAAETDRKVALLKQTLSDLYQAHLGQNRTEVSKNYGRAEALLMGLGLCIRAERIARDLEEVLAHQPAAVNLLEAQLGDLATVAAAEQGRS